MKATEKQKSPVPLSSGPHFINDDEEPELSNCPTCLSSAPARLKNGSTRNLPTIARTNQGAIAPSSVVSLDVEAARLTHILKSYVPASNLTLQGTADLLRCKNDPDGSQSPHPVKPEAGTARKATPFQARYGLEGDGCLHSFIAAQQTHSQSSSNTQRSYSHSSSHGHHQPSSQPSSTTNTTNHDASSPTPEHVQGGLTKEDVQTLFSGAPHFMLEKGRRGRYFPQAYFPWNNQLDITDLEDRVYLKHESFALATLHAHLPVPEEVGWKPVGDCSFCSKEFVDAIIERRKERLSTSTYLPPGFCCDYTSSVHAATAFRLLQER